MKRSAIVVSTLVVALTSAAYAEYTFENKGTWPDTWPKELDGPRTQSRTLAGPKEMFLHYAIPFKKRAEFEAAWPHLLKVKTPRAPIVLRRGPSFWLGKEQAAGVCVHTPPDGEPPIHGKDAAGNWERTIYIELIVDGEIVDLNRIELPPETPIIDERFKDQADAK
jgi:hypothetical protein